MKKFAFLLLFSIELFANPLNFQSLKSDFTMEVKSNKASINYKGNLAISGNKAYWHYEKPSLKDIYIVNTDSFIQIDRVLEQVIFTKINKLPSFHNILKNAKEINANHYQALYDDIVYNIYFANSKLSKITYTDKLDNEVEILFINPLLNTKIDDNIFKAKYPKDYDVIYN